VEQYLITLLVKIGVVAAIASFGVRSNAVKRMLRREERTLEQRFWLALWFVALFAPGVAIRALTGTSYQALDLGLEGSLLAGITGGYFCGWLAGMLISVPAMAHHETLSLFFFALAGLGGGLLRDSASDREDIWRFSPFPEVNFYRVFQPGRDLRSALLHGGFTAGVFATEFLRELLASLFPGRLFTLGRWGDPPERLFGLYVATYFCITLPLKVWNNTIELIRFGDKLRVEKHIEPGTSDMLVPSMLLQPLVENSLRHGLSGKVEGGTITLRARRNGTRLVLEIEDDGVGIPEAQLSGILNKGIGVSNVKERLKVLYNQDYRMLIDSQPGRGTRIEIEVPEMQPGAASGETQPAQHTAVS